MNKLLLLLTSIMVCSLSQNASAQVKMDNSTNSQTQSVNGTQNSAITNPAPAPTKKKRKKAAAKSTNAIAAPTNEIKMEQAPSRGNVQTIDGSTPVNAAPGNSSMPSNINQGTPANSGTAAATPTAGNPGQGSATIEDVIKKSAPIIEKDKNGEVDWTHQYIEAVGESAIDNVRFTNPAQAKLMAKRGAVTIAQRNLLEVTKGVNVVGETTVKDMITTSDYVYTRVEGIVKGAEMVGEAIEQDGIIKVRLRMPLYAPNGLASAVYNNLPANGSASGDAGTVTTEQGGANGTMGTGGINNTNPQTGALADAQKLLVNLGGQKFDPSLFPLITDDKGNILLDFKKLYDPTTGKFPQIVQASKQLMNDMGVKNGAQVIDAVQSKIAGNLVISSESAKKINWSKIGQTAAKVGKFLMMLI